MEIISRRGRWTSLQFLWHQHSEVKWVTHWNIVENSIQPWIQIQGMWFYRHPLISKWVLFNLTIFSGKPQRCEPAVSGNCPRANLDRPDNLKPQEYWCCNWLWKVQVTTGTCRPCLSLIFISRDSILLRARVQSAIEKNLLCLSQPILLLTLARDLDECSENNPDVLLPSFFSWRWWMPSCTLLKRSKKAITINSCKELEK